VDGQRGRTLRVVDADSLPDLGTQIGNIDLVYEATGASQLSFDTIQILGTNGVFCFTGVPGRKAPISIDADLLMRNLVLKNQLVFGTVNAGAEAFAASIKDLTAFHARWPEQVKALVTGRFAPEAAVELLTGQSKGIKNVISFG
jgi:threonine dehydrogenase-like Zn-dependent dehydrogenase